MTTYNPIISTFDVEAVDDSFDVPNNARIIGVISKTHNKSQSSTFIANIIKYCVIIRIFLSIPDIIMCIMGFYFTRFPPDYLQLPIKLIIFFLLIGIFKLISLIIFVFVKKYIRKVVQNSNEIEQGEILVKFSMKTINTMPLWGDNMVFFGTAFVWLNMCLDLIVLVYAKCHGNTCTSVTMTHSSNTIAHTEYLRKILEVHILNAMAISNFLHIAVVPIFIYVWNYTRLKSNCFDKCCKILDKILDKIP